MARDNALFLIKNPNLTLQSNKNEEKQENDLENSYDAEKSKLILSLLSSHEEELLKNNFTDIIHATEISPLYNFK